MNGHRGGLPGGGIPGGIPGGGSTGYVIELAIPIDGPTSSSTFGPTVTAHHLRRTTTGMSGSIPSSIPSTGSGMGSGGVCTICASPFCDADGCCRTSVHLQCCTQTMCVQCLMKMCKRCRCKDACDAVIAFCPYCREISPATALDLFTGAGGECRRCAAVNCSVV